jgi:SAM-dependent methyltransferase
MLALAGDVRGRRILDAGCGAGPLSEALRARGAVVTGFDSSPAMVALALSVNHPRILEASDPKADYFSITRYSFEYTFGEQRAVLTFWHRPLHAMTDAFTQAGFRIAVVSEPPFSPDTPRELLPPDIGDRTAFICFICFIFFVLEAH